MKNKIRLSTVLNIILLILMVSVTYSWMVTEPSYGEVVNYERDLIVASSGVEVSIYKYEDNDYVLYDEDDIIVNNMAPNDTIRFKFVLKNSKKVTTMNDIIFANIYGDIDILKSYISFESSSPSVFVKTLDKNLQTTSTFGGINVTNYMRFYDDFKVESGTESTIYWTIKLDKSAGNEITEKSLVIDNIIFLNS